MFLGNEKWIIEKIANKDLKIYKNSIILTEVKLSSPDKNTYIGLNEKIEKNRIQNYLYFVIYKLIKKISYYKELFINEYLTNNKDFTTYIFQLFLVYDSKPYSNINNYVAECLENLIKDNLIENEFIFQVLYLIPTMSRYTSKMLNDKIQDNEKQINELNKKLDDAQKEINKITKLVEQLKEQIKNGDKNNNNNNNNNNQKQ